MTTFLQPGLNLYKINVVFIELKTTFGQIARYIIQDEPYHITLEIYIFKHFRVYYVIFLKVGI